MRCELVEERLNRLLDKRQNWNNDSRLVAHCAYCDSCRALAEAYSAVVLATAEPIAAPKLPASLSARVLAEVVPRENVSRSPVTVRFPNFQRYMVAAVLLIAALPAAMLYRFSPQPSDGTQIIVQTEGSSAARWKLTGLLDEEARLSDEVWVSTGREIAKLPHQVRRATVFTESTPLTGAIRPVAVAWQTLWGVIPGEAVPSDPPAGETSYIVAFPDASFA